MKVTDPGFNPSGSGEIDAIKSAGVAVEAIIKENTKPGKRQALALTHLEIALMFAVKSAVVGDE